MIWLLTGCPWVGAGDLSRHVDADQDGHAAPAFDGDDCDDRDPDVYPGAVEVWYDGVDQDCSGGSDFDQDRDGLDAIPEGGDCDDLDRAVGAPATTYADGDRDGYGDPGAPIVACAPPAGATSDATDCDDADSAVSPAATERCGGGDEDCDTLTDDADPDVDPTSQLEWFADLDGDGFGGPELAAIACAGPAGATLEPLDCDDDDPDRFPGQLERCNGADDDCDLAVDDADPDVEPSAVWYADVDEDGFGDQETAIRSCEPIHARTNQGGDCADHDPAVSPAAVEQCGGLDDDCDGLVDEADPELVGWDWFTDGDADGYGDGLAAVGCADPGEASRAGGDCDDADAAVHPSAVESCDGLDDDCDGALDADDPDLVVLWFEDADADGYGGPAIPGCPPGQPGWLPSGGDCDDARPDVNPAESEVYYDGVDQDCDPGNDDDQDLDGASVYVDCDDTDPSRGGEEVWYDGVDQDCSGGSDFDQDGDGHLSPAGGGDDCDDLDPTIAPGAPEVWYDDIDQDCAGGDDFDQDGDGFRFVPRGEDCFDDDPARTDGGHVSVLPGSFASLAEAVAALACDGGVVEFLGGLVDDPAFTLGPIGRPVTLRGAGAGVTTFVGVAWDTKGGLTLEALTLTGATKVAVLQANGATPMQLVEVECVGNDDGCAQAPNLIVRGSTFSDNGGPSLDAGESLEVYDSAFTSDGAPLALGPAGRLVLQDVAFTDVSAPGEPVVALDEADATLTRVTFDRCSARSLVEEVTGGDLHLEDVVGLDNQLESGAIAARSLSGAVSIDGLTLVDTAPGVGPVIDLAGRVGPVHRVSVHGTDSVDAALSLLDQRLVPVNVRNLSIRGHAGVGIRLAAFATLSRATVVGASVAVEQVGADQLVLVSSILVDNGLAVDRGEQYFAQVQSTVLFANDVDLLPEDASADVVRADPLFVTWDPGLDWRVWDLHLAPPSPAVDLGEPGELDPDGTVGDAGVYALDPTEPW
ncbi:MAG: putative metal-binding motif-containing protein, partial [Myxococcota bacterium]